MTTRIQTLTPMLANQIAAGEVIERPASVVKELLENSLDAGATKIDFDIEQGGMRLIRVHDNGSGIHPDDLVLALSRHATSKIKNLDDLEQIMTLGFRGEALASISSVSRLTLSSATADGSGWQVTTEQGVTPFAHTQGTTVEVRDLFFNTPARRKFLRTEKTEFDHIDEVVKRVALSSFDTSFTLKHNQRLVRQYRAARSDIEREQRISDLCGSAFIENARKIEIEATGLRLWGWIALPSFSRAQADSQYFYVNGRVVRDKLVNHAIRKAYHDVMYGDRHPAYVLFLEIASNQVDVNVHPTKHEVRFRESRLVYDFISNRLKNVLSETMVPVGQPEPVMQPKTISAPQQNVLWDRPPQTTSFKIREQMAVYNKLHEPAPTWIPEKEATVPPLGFALAQLKGIYILAENADGFVMVDMHAAHERVLYEQMKKNLANQTIVSQPLLVPLTVTLSEREANSIEKNLDMLNRLGLQIQRLSPESIVVREVPDLLRNGNIEQLIRDVASDFVTHDRSSRVEEMIEHLLGEIACHSAIQAHRKMTIPEMNALLRSMEITENNGYCNHGRPTTLRLTLAELDKMFLRGR